LEYNKQVAEFLLYEEAPHYDHCTNMIRQNKVAWQIFTKHYDVARHKNVE